jgi:hypothetical protein
LRKSRSRGSSLSKSSRSYQSRVQTVSIVATNNRPLPPSTHMQHKRLIDILLPDVGAKVRVLDETQKELVHDLQMRPSEFQNGFIFLWVESVSRGVDLGRNRSEQVGRELSGRVRTQLVVIVPQFNTPSEFSLATHHSDDLGVNSLGNNPPPDRDIIQHLMQSLTLCMLFRQISRSVVKVENV